MRMDVVTVPPGGGVEELVVDRRSGRSWTVHVEPFEVATTVVTRGLWDELHGRTGDPAVASLPKTEVSWREAILFCNELSARHGLTTVYAVSECEVPEPTQWRPHSQPEADDWIVAWDQDADGYRLLTDAEWQVACRAGTTGARYGELGGDIAWYEGDSGGKVHPVRTKTPNAWGLFDMLGGVWEMVLGSLRSGRLRVLPHHSRRRME